MIIMSEQNTLLKKYVLSDKKALTLKQYVVLQKDAAKRGEWMGNDITEFSENDEELMWDLIRQWVLFKGLGEAVDDVADAARWIRKGHPDEQISNKAGDFEKALYRLSEEIGPDFGTRE
jgi:hypothetical protein